MSKPEVLPVRPENIPFEMTVQPRWILWDYRQREGQWVKVPLKINGKPAKVNDPSTWSTFDEALDAYRFGDYSGIGIVLDGSGLACIDLDKCIDGDGGYTDQAQEVLNALDTYTEVSASGRGLHLFVDSPRRGNFTKPFEFYTGLRYIAVTGHVLPGRVDLAESDLAFLDSHGQVAAAVAEEDEDAAALEALKPPIEGYGIEETRELLEHIDADCSREDWLRVLMGLHHQGNGDEEWLQLAIEWSESGTEKFVSEDDVARRWISFSEDRSNKVTLASVIKMADVEKQKDHVKAYDQFVEMVKTATSRDTLEGEICTAIKDSEELTEIDRHGLAALVKAALKKQFSVDAPISAVRALVIPPVIKVNQNTPKEMRRFVWVRALDCFYDTEKRVKCSVRSFDAEFKRLMPVGQSGMRASAADEMITTYEVDTVDDLMYYPGKPEVFEYQGLRYGNTYRITDMADVEIPLTPRGEQAVAAFLDHVQWMLPGREREQRLVMSYLAWIVQNPGERMHWALVIEGREGTGKTMLGEMMREVLGYRNVGIVSSADVVGNFSGWAGGSMLKVIEELKLHGHNRYDAANKLKPLITNTNVSVEEKGRNAQIVVNTASYLIFTNHLDAVPLDDGDRRYCVISLPRTAAEAQLRVTEFRRFGELYRAAPGAIRTFLLGFDAWEPDFDPRGRAPSTDAKLEAIEMSRQDPELIVRELLETKGPGIGETVVATRMLVAEAGRRIRENGGRPPQTNGWGMIMRNLGWTHGGQIRWRNEAHKYWYLGPEKPELDEIRKKLDESVRESIADEFGVDS